MVVGRGLTINISTQCTCSEDESATSLEKEGVSHAYSAAFSAAVTAAPTHNMFMSTLVTNYLENSTFRVTTVLINSMLCGGLNSTGVPVCQTDFSDHKTAEVLMEYMTDGTTASIAPKYVEVRKIDGDADINAWAHTAMVHLLGAGVQTIALPSQTPAMISPLLWWATVDLMAIDPAMIEPGLETTFAILFRYRCGRDRSPSHSLIHSLTSQCGCPTNLHHGGIQVHTRSARSNAILSEDD